MCTLKTATTSLEILRGQVNNMSSITVTWDPLPCSYQHGHTVGYSVHYTSASLSRRIRLQITSSSEAGVSTEVSVNPFTEYDFEVAAVWESGVMGPYTPSITLFSPAEGELISPLVQAWVAGMEVGDLPTISFFFSCM